jgi:hypothetical protein
MLACVVRVSWIREWVKEELIVTKGLGILEQVLNTCCVLGGVELIRLSAGQMDPGKWITGSPTQENCQVHVIGELLDLKFHLPFSPAFTGDAEPEGQAPLHVISILWLCVVSIPGIIIRRGEHVRDVLEVVTCVYCAVDNGVRSVSLLVLVHCPVCRGKWKSLTGVPGKWNRVTKECWVEAL